MGKRGELNNEQVVGAVKHLKDTGEDITIEQAEMGAYLEHILTGLEHLSKLYKSGTLEEKRQITGSISPKI